MLNFKILLSRISTKFKNLLQVKIQYHMLEFDKIPTHIVLEFQLNF